MREAKSHEVVRSCRVCGREFLIAQSAVKRGRGRICSDACRGRAEARAPDTNPAVALGTLAIGTAFRVETTEGTVVRQAPDTTVVSYSPASGKASIRAAWCASVRVRVVAGNGPENDTDAPRRLNPVPEWVEDPDKVEGFIRDLAGA